ncbi:hypothetical protein [Streptomyces sp. NBC_00576]|uniref:hypothetical protein n=1 Tax=Streptomyces sp. NBC_00576 TaxID=2903665 RepID=UPI002E801511|nr:hypothetical protein [Streptomyces sp. NBC_00576]WUB70985.1 hypothetical protein OG734_13320 [Streptomyces sp. NBC_00576]
MRIVLCLLLAVIVVIALLACDAGEPLQLFHAPAEPSILSGVVASAAGTVKRVPLTPVGDFCAHQNDLRRATTINHEQGNGEHA